MTTANICTPLDRRIVLLLVVFTQRNFVADFIRLKLNFLILFTKPTPFGGVRGNVRTSSIARWKARGGLPIRNNWIFCASSYGSDFNKKYQASRRLSAIAELLVRLTSSIIRKIMHKIGFMGHPMGASGAIYALYLKFFTQRNLVAEFRWENVSFIRKTANSCFWATLSLGG